MEFKRSGKSNLISFFEMISYIMIDSFQQYIADNGFANNILAQKPRIKFTSETSENKYDFRLSHIVTTQSERLLNHFEFKSKVVLLITQIVKYLI